MTILCLPFSCNSCTSQSAIFAAPGLIHFAGKNNLAVLLLTNVIQRALEIDLFTAMCSALRTVTGAGRC